MIVEIVECKGEINTVESWIASSALVRVKTFRFAGAAFINEMKWKSGNARMSGGEKERSIFEINIWRASEAAWTPLTQTAGIKLSRD